MAENKLIWAFFTIFVVLFAGCHATSSDVFDDTLEKIGEIDQKHGLSIQDYGRGVAYIKYNPRFPDPLNAGEVDAVVTEFEDIGSELENGTPAKLLVDARTDLLLSEKFYKLATKTKKGLVSDGFRCDHKIFIEAAGINFGSCVRSGRSAVENLKIIVDDYPDHADKVNITKFWVKYLNSTYDLIEEDVDKEKELFNRICS